MLFRTVPVRNRLLACAASLALAAGLMAGPADAGSKDKLWRQRGDNAVHVGPTDGADRKAGHFQQRAQRGATTPPLPPRPAAPAFAGGNRKNGHIFRNVAPSPQPPQLNRRHGNPGLVHGSARPPAPPAFVGRDRRSGQAAVFAPPPPPRQFDRQRERPGLGHGSARPPVPPAFAGRDRRSGQGTVFAPPPPPQQLDRRRDRPGFGHGPAHPPAPPVFAGKDRRPRHGDDHRRDHHGGDRHYKHKHRHHETHVTHHHVYRHYYYRTSSRHYYYINAYPQRYSYPVYYLVPYHVHATPGYHSHGEEAMYCQDGYRQGGVYRGGAYSRGASRQTGGAIIGGILGAAVGSQFGSGKGQLVAVGVGTVLGALIGGDVGRTMDRQDHAYATGSFGHAMESVPSCTTIKWDNPQTGSYGSVTPMHTYEPEPGRYCREFQQQVAIGGELQNAYGTACRQPDGSWEIVAAQP